MILPNKYLKVSNSLYYTGALIISVVDKKKYNIVDLWNEFKKIYNGISYHKFIQSIIYLYTISAISYDEKGEIFNENS